MTTITAPRSWTGTRGLRALIGAEARLFLRDRANLFFVVLLPSVLFLGMGLAIPGMREPMTDVPAPWLGLRAIDLFTPLILCVAVATAGLTTVAPYLANYRETGVLRRMSTTPMRPQGVLVAQGVVQFAGVVVGSSLALLVGRLGFDTTMPERPLLALLTFALAVVSMFGIGVLIGGLAPKGTTASGIGLLFYFPLLFLAGLWTPGPMMPEAVHAVATWSPLGAASQAMNAAWFDAGLPWLQLAIMALWGVALFTVAALTFRWE